MSIGEKAKARLFRKKNVILITEDMNKIQGGQDTGRPAVTIGVIQKVVKFELKRSDRVPKKVKGLETDVIEVGDIKLLAVTEDRTKRWRPVPGGVSVGHKNVSAGSTWGVVEGIEDGLLYLLSNNHVLANLNNALIGDPIYQPGPYDGGTEDDTVADLAKFIPIQKDESIISPCKIAQTVTMVLNWCAALVGSRTFLLPVRKTEAENRMDCAIALFRRLSDITTNVLGLGKSTEVCTLPTIGLEVQMSGRTTGVATEQIRSVNATVRPDMGDGTRATFTDQLLIGPMCQPGDSGSRIIDMQTRIVGLVFAGSSQTTVANKIVNVFKDLKVRLPTR